MIRLGVIGLDHPHAPGAHLPALRYIQNRVKVVAITHRKEDDARPWVEEFSAQFFPDRDSMLAECDMDAVLITTPNIEHVPDSIAAAEAAVDVLCDKPIAITLEEGRRLVETIEKTRVRFLTTFPVRFNRSVRRLKAAVDAGELGKIQAIMMTNHGRMYEPGEPDWVRDPARNGGGCLMDHTVHSADIIRLVTGAEFATVRAEAATALRPIQAEDVGVLHGEMTDGTIYQIDASWSRRGTDPMWGDVTMRLVGTKGSATLDLYNNQRIELYADGDLGISFPNYLCREHGEIFLDYAVSKEEGIPPAGASEIDGLRTVELVIAAYRSIVERKRVEVVRS
jgi:UDP-N-acetylglucosamine 3-dehydrogenase